MNNETNVTREECEAWSIRADDAGRLARAHLALLATVETLSNNDTVRNIAAGIEDVRAGRIKSLSCVEGGCERDKLIQMREIVDLYFAPWGAAKIAQLEEHIGDGMFSPEAVLRKIQEILKERE